MRHTSAIFFQNFSSDDWCSVTLSSIWPQRRRHAVWLTWRLFPSVLYTFSSFFVLFPGGACEQQTERYYLIFFMHVLLQYEFTVFGYNELLLHLSVSSSLVNHGDKVFHYPPTAIAVFSSHAEWWVQDAVGSLLRELSSCAAGPTRHWEGVFSQENKLDQWLRI